MELRDAERLFAEVDADDRGARARRALPTGCRRRSRRRRCACPATPPAHLLDPAEAQRIDLVQRPEHRAVGIPPVMGERAEFRELARVDVGGGGSRGHGGRSLQLVLPDAGATHDSALVDGRQSAIRDDAPSPDPYVGHGVAPDRVDKMRNRIVAGDARRCRKGRPRRYRPPCPEPSEPSVRSRPSARAPPSVAACRTLARGERGGVVGRRPWRAARRAASRRRDRAGCSTPRRRCRARRLMLLRGERRDRRDAAAELHVRCRAVHDMAAMGGEKIDVVGGEMHAVDRDEARTGRAEVDGAARAASCR